MEKPDIILESLRYIETHLKTPVSVQEIAGQSGYSVYHYSREFKKQMNRSVMDYVKRRRLIKASEEILNGRNVIDAAAEYGYESHSGFTRSFRKEFGFSPSLLKALSLSAGYLKGDNCMNPLFMEKMNPHATKEELFQVLTEEAKKSDSQCSWEKLYRAYALACQAYRGQKRYSGDDYVIHPVNTAILLIRMGAGEDLAAAGLLCDALAGKTRLTAAKIEEMVSAETAAILKRAVSFAEDQMDLADEDVVMLKLAERLHNMRTLEFMDQDQWKKKADETLRLFLPVANRFGWEELTAELGELGMKYTDC